MRVAINGSRVLEQAAIKEDLMGSYLGGHARVNVPPEPFFRNEQPRATGQRAESWWAKSTGILLPTRIKPPASAPVTALPTVTPP